MVNELISAIAKRIKSVITEDAIIRVDSLEQTLPPKPLFMIKLLNSAEKDSFCTSTVRHNFVVTFFPKDLNAENNELLNQGAEALLFAFKKIPLHNGRIKKGLNRRTEISEGVLHVFFSIDLTLWELEETAKVRALEAERSIK